MEEISLDLALSRGRGTPSGSCLQVALRAGDLQQPRHVEMFLARVGQGVERRLVQHGFVGGRQAQVPALQRGQRPARRRAQQRRQPGRGQCLAQPRRMTRRTRLIGDHPGERQPRLELRKALDGRRQAAGGSVGVDHQEDRGGEARRFPPCCLRARRARPRRTAPSRLRSPPGRRRRPPGQKAAARTRAKSSRRRGCSRSGRTPGRDRWGRGSRGRP